MNLVPGMKKTIDHVGIDVSINPSSVQNMTIPVQKCTNLVARMPMEDVLMITKVTDTLNVETGASGTVTGQDITTYPVEASAYIGEFLIQNKEIIVLFSENMQKIFLSVRENVFLEYFHARELAMLNIYIVKIVAIKQEKYTLV